MYGEILIFVSEFRRIEETNYNFVSVSENLWGEKQIRSTVPEILRGKA